MTDSFAVYYEPAVPFDQQRSEVRAEIGRRVSERIDGAPGVQRIATDKAQIYAVEDFLAVDECERLVAMIDESWIPARLLDHHKHEGTRTGQSSDLSGSDPLVDIVNRRIADLLGLDPTFGEPLQGQRYLEGQEYQPHPDFFYVDQDYWPECNRQGGQRTWTAMVYLNHPERGGGTGFPNLNLEAQPWPGRMLIWNNMAPDGSPNSWTIHAGLPVEQGRKYIVTKWFRERPYGKLQ